MDRFGLFSKGLGFCSWVVGSFLGGIGVLSVRTSVRSLSEPKMVPGASCKRFSLTEYSSHPAMWSDRLTKKSSASRPGYGSVIPLEPDTRRNAALKEQFDRIKWFNVHYRTIVSHRPLPRKAQCPEWLVQKTCITNVFCVPRSDVESFDSKRRERVGEFERWWKM